MPPKIWFAFIREKKIIQVIISYSSLIQTIFSLKLTNTPLKKNGGKGRHSGFFLGKRSILIRGKLVVRFKFREDITHTQEKHIKNPETKKVASEKIGWAPRAKDHLETIDF